MNTHAETKTGGNQVMHAEDPIIVRDLTKHYGRIWRFPNGRTRGEITVGVENVTFSVHKGEIFGFLGPNGAGKTTTMRSVLAYLHLQGGEITVLGMDHDKERLAIRHRLGYVPGDVTLYKNFTGNELIEYFSTFRSNDDEMLAKLRSIFRVDYDKRIKKLSKGNRQQVALTVALASNPELLIMDEPSAGLDPLIVSRLHALLRELAASGTTIFLSSHDLAEVQAVCNRVGMIRNGKILIVERVEDLRERAVQQLTVHFHAHEDENRLAGFQDLEGVLSAEQINDNTIRARITGNINEIIQFLATREIRRMSIEDAPLEEIFLHYYEDEPEEEETVEEEEGK